MQNEFIVPTNLEELSHVLKNKNDKTYVLAGGTDLIIKFIKEEIHDFNIINISKLKELTDIKISDDRIKIGPCVTMTQIENNEELKRHIPALSHAATSVGSTQIRNKATIGGNIANASQCGDTIPVLFAYDAKLKILNSSNEYRYEKVRDFILGINKTKLKSDEAIIGIEIQKTKSVSSFSKIGSRKTVTIAKINCCGKFNISDDGLIEEGQIYLGSVGVKPIKADLIEQALIGKKVNSINKKTKDAINEQIEKAIPDRSSKHYKKVAAIGVIEDMLNNIRR